jgi:tetraacyldisaccharide 4'-kinase
MTLAPARVHQLTTGRALSWRAWRAEFGQTPVSAVAAIGQPERCFAMLRHDGIKLERALALPDHDDYARSPFTNLPRAPILITAKDAVKCTRFNDDRLWVVHADPQFSDPGWLDAIESELRDTAARKQRMARNGSRP